ncbi:MAG: hypothetical protein Q9217_000127 [Psora testacea]
MLLLYSTVLDNEDMASHGVPKIAGGPPDSAEARSKEQKTIAEYKTLVAMVNHRISSGVYSEETLGITSKLLTWNPEYYTVWNHRRRILRYLLTHENSQLVEASDMGGTRSTKDTIVLISNDLGFLIPLLRKFPKCYWIWNYRHWLLEESTLLLPASQARRLWEQELALAGKMLSQDSRNFHGWGYRRTVIAALENPGFRLDADSKSLTEQEFHYTTKMINTNLSNFSAWHNRSKLIPRLLEERQADDKARRNFLDEELELIQRALWAGDQDQSLWFYHQYLMCTFDPRFSSQSITPHLSTGDRIRYVSAEIDKVRDMLEGAEDCKYIYQALIDLGTLYKDLSGAWPAQADQLREWLAVLRKLDPLREGRWKDLSAKLQAG